MKNIDFVSFSSVVLNKLTYPVLLAGMRDVRAVIAVGFPIVAFSLSVFWPRAAA